MHVHRFAGLVLALALAAPSHSAVVFQNLGTTNPPLTLGMPPVAIPVTPFDLVPQMAIADFTWVSDIPGSPVPGILDITSVMPPTAPPNSLEKRTIGSGWATWSHGYTGPVYFTGTAGTDVTLTLPGGACAFYLYIEPNAFGLFPFEVTTNSGATSGPIMVDGNAGATGFAFYCTAGEIISTITIDQTSSSAQGFSIAEFGIAANLTNPSCNITSPTTGSLVMGSVPIVFDVDDPNMDPLTVAFEYSPDGGMTWLPATAAASSLMTNPSLGVPSPQTGLTFTWNSLADGVGTALIVIAPFRVTVNDGSSPQSECTVFVLVDNQSPPPSCILNPPMGVVSGNISIAVDAMSFSSPTLDIALEWSSDGGLTFVPCTMAGGSPGPNPRIGAPVGISTFLWDSRGDGAALSGVAGIPVRATVSDGGPITSDCIGVLSVDNGMLCGGICGDCNQNGVGPDVVDALAAAQIAVGIITPTAVQAACCDVNVSGQVDVVDALFIAQAAAGIPVVLICA